MNDHNEMNDQNEDDLRAQVRALFASAADVPRDVVPGSGLTIEDVRAQNDAAGTWRLGRTPARIVEDVDGIPAYVIPGEEIPTYVAGPVISQADADRLGIDPTDFPNVRILP